MKDLSSFKVYTSECGEYDTNFLKPIGFDYTNDLEKADVVMFGGGADVDPENYGEKPGSRTHVSRSKEAREREDFRKAMNLGIKMFGICRGFQLLCTLAGGKLIQDVSGHGGNHKMDTFDGNNFVVNSLHHQMVNPYTIKDLSSYRILGWSPKRLSKAYLGAADKPIYLPYEFKEVEAAIFPRINAFGVQFHPEMMFNGSRYTKEQGGAVVWTQQTFLKFFNNNL